MKNIKSFGDFVNENYIGESEITEKVKGKPITKKHWDKADDDQKEEWLLQAFSDPDDAMEYVEMDWNDLPPQATSNMYESLNEKRATYLPGPDKDIADFLKPFAKKSVDSLGFGYKGGSPYYNIEIDATSGYDNKDLPKDVFGLTPYANGDYWSKRHLKKVAPMFAKDLNSLQKKYKVEFLEYDSKANQVLIKVTK